MNYGIQLYSVRDAMAEDMAGAMQKIADLGCVSRFAVCEVGGVLYFLSKVFYLMVHFFHLKLFH